MDVSRYADHSPYSDPGRHAPLLAAVTPDPARLHVAVTTAVVHYRAGATAPTPAQLDDVDRRWVASTLDAVVERSLRQAALTLQLQQQPVGDVRGLQDGGDPMGGARHRAVFVVGGGQANLCPRREGRPPRCPAIPATRQRCERIGRS